MRKEIKTNILVLFFSLIVIMLGFGLVMPFVPFFIERFGAGGSELGVLIASYGLMQFIFAPIWGDISDRWGRKKVMIAGMLGNGVTLLAFGFANSLWVLFVARILSGALASAMVPASMAYIGDITDEEERGSGLGLIGAAAGAGIVIGPGLGGFLAAKSLAFPFIVAAFLSLVSSLLIFFFLPESLPAERGSKNVQRSITLQYARMKKALLSPIGILLIMTFIVSFGLTNFQGIYGLFALKKFGYGPQKVGTILMVMGAVLAIGQGVIAGSLIKRFREELIIKVSLILSSIGFVSMVVVRSYPGVLASTGIFILAISLLRTSIAALISKKSAIGQGVAMGLNDSFKSLGRIIGPVWAGFIFDINANYPYITGAVIMLIGFVLGLVRIEEASEKDFEKVS
ncbi:MAG: MFS transporter [Firmicutes bacterium]|nr:MFS transporter [Bacillota bacterium]